MIECIEVLVVGQYYIKLAFSRYRVKSKALDLFASNSSEDSSGKEMTVNNN